MEEDKRDLDTTNVFVKYLPPGVDDQCLHDLFSPHGTIVSARVMVDPHSWKSLGYGFVKFGSGEEAHGAIAKMSGYKIANKTLMCKLSNTFAFTAPSPNLYIKPLPPNFTEDTLCNMFEEFGVIKTIKIVRDQSKPNDVVGLIRYEFVDSALSAIHSTHGYTVVPGWPPLTVRFAESDVQRAVRKANNSPLIRQRDQIERGQLTNLVAENRSAPNYFPGPLVRYSSGMNMDPPRSAPMLFTVYTVFAAPRPETNLSPVGWYNSFKAGMITQYRAATS